jgi:hypothetical protein
MRTRHFVAERFAFIIHVLPQLLQLANEAFKPGSEKQLESHRREITALFVTCAASPGSPESAMRTTLWLCARLSRGNRRNHHQV